MKKFILSVALALGAVGAAHAQVYFDSGSDRPNNPRAAQRQLAQHRVHPRQPLVRCRDGVRRIARLCRGHGGMARR